MNTTQQLVTQLCDYIDIPSKTGHERLYLERLEADFRERGYRLERQTVEADRWNLLALPKSTPTALFSTHVDVVPPHLAARLHDGSVYGRGACDTKGGLVAMMAAADTLDPEREWLGFLLVVGEEVDHIGARRAAELDLRVERIVLCEPTTGHLVCGQKGILKLGLTTRGEAAHSAFPDLGSNALTPMLAALRRLEAADYPSDPVLGPTTLNIGVLQAGVAANVTPPLAYAELVYRVVSDLDALLAQVEALCGAEVGIELQSRNPALKLRTVPGFETEVIAFNTDAYYLEALGPVLLMGPGDIRVAHGDGEHLSVDDLMRGVDDFVRLMRASAGPTD